MMTVDEAIDCVRNGWQITCPVGQKQAAVAMASEIIWLRKELNELQTEKGQAALRAERADATTESNEET